MIEAPAPTEAAADRAMYDFVRRVGAQAPRKQATKPWPANIVAVLAHMVLQLDARVAELERKVLHEDADV